MERKLRKALIFCVFFFVLFTNKVYANSYSLFFRPDSNRPLHPGDVIEFFAGYKGIAVNASMSSHNFTIIYDSNIFEILEYAPDPNVDPAIAEIEGKNPYNVREGWQTTTRGPKSVGLKAKSSQYYLTYNDVKATCDECLVLFSFKLKVKDVISQNTKVQLVDQSNYIEEIDLTIHKPSTVNNLASLKVGDQDLDLNSGKTSFEVNVPYDVDKVMISASTVDPFAYISSGYGEKAVSVGDNTFSIEVVAENGDKKIYTVKVIRKTADDDTSLSKILVTDSNKNKVLLTYDDNNKTYTGTVSTDITFVSFDIQCGGLNCTVDKLASEAIKDGKNEFKFTVVSQSNNKQEYTIIINKEDKKEVNTKDDKSKTNTNSTNNKNDRLVPYLLIGFGLGALLCGVAIILFIRVKNNKNK